jgi:uncharacterized repeat protein (TIGR02543 family)
MMKNLLKISIFVVLSILLVSCGIKDAPYDYTMNQIIDSIAIEYQEGDNIDRVTQDLVLPTTSSLDDRASITWSSSLPDVISTSGVVSRPADSVEVTLDYDVKYGNFALVKSVTMTVLGTHITISFDSNGGSDVESVTGVAGTSVTSISDPIKEGYDFLGWSLNGESYTLTTIPEDSIEVVAVWDVVSYQIDYVLDGGINHENNPASITIEDEATLSAPSKDGYQFIGWYLDENLEGEAITSINYTLFNGDYTLYAAWQINTYTITFITNGGSSIEDIDAAFGEMISEPTDPTRDAYTFNGWYMDRDFIEAFTFDTMPGNDIELYALWVADDGYVYSGYYSGATGLDGDNLITYLYNLMREDFEGVTYGAARDYLQVTDEDPNNPNNIILVYTGDSIKSTWDGGVTWNREHVWPQSKLDSSADNGTVNSASDLNNLKPADPGENSSRSNDWFGETNVSNSYEPRDEVKGDIARILFYMDIMYDFLTLVEFEGNEEAGYYEMGDLSTLIEWHENDPVDDFEMNRNNVIESIQGNRNPFIDHPEFVNKIWGVETTLLSVDITTTTLSAMI